MLLQGERSGKTLFQRNRAFVGILPSLCEPLVKVFFL